MKYKDFLPRLCAIGGLFLLAAAIVVCGSLARGGWSDHFIVALFLLALASLAVWLIWFETHQIKLVMVVLLPIGAGIFLRALCLDCTTGDFNGFLTNWYNYFVVNGGFAAIAHSVGDYNVPYLYFIAAISYLRMPALYLYKSLSLLFDVLLAWGCFRLVRLVRSGRPDQCGVHTTLIAFGCAFLLPTVIINGSYWAQCDAIYAALAVHAVALALEGNDNASVALMGIAFSFKLQAVFILPLWGIMWLAGKVRFRALWVFPLSYLLMIAPALAMGKPLRDIVGVYVTQAGEYSRLTLNAPSIYQLLPYGTEKGGIAPYLGIAAAGILVLILLLLGLWMRHRLDAQLILAISVLLTIGIPFLLPHMHERYFFLADVFTLCYACNNVRYVPAAVLVNSASLSSYFVYLRSQFHIIFYLGGNKYGMLLEMSAVLVALVWTITTFMIQLRTHTGEERLHRSAQ